MTGVKPFVVIATPRSGSNWLCTLLDSHPQILCHHELFNPDGVHLAWSLRGTDFKLGGLELQRNHPLALLERAWANTLGFSHVGFKLNVGQSEAVFNTVLDAPEVRKILVYRRNRVRAFVSECIAEASGQWESYPESEPPRAKQAVRVDPDALRAHARRNADYLHAIRQRLQGTGQRALEVAYEDLEEAQTRAQMLDFLGVDPGISLLGGTRRMNPEPLSRLVSNLDELAAAVKGDDLAADLAAEASHD